ncbi:glutathione peroxidase [Phenylobacterium sp.]|uniref:glutathione peroxidase n=1 Tax=Phenylobacterium sp. TaxID=1871053 RepID=UPI00286BF5A2|nr:glutathione peroxidase [Phenylobacterium sp.]
MTTIYDFAAETLDGAPAPLSAYRDKVVLIVNTASKCGFTPQYAGLEALWRKYRDQGLVILGFPCNQFGAQEPGDAAEIASFCSLTYDVDFPMMRKVDVNGPATHPLYAWLKHEKKGLLGSEGVKWNFTKFLVNRKGEVVSRYAPTDKPESLEGAIEALL